MKISPKTLEILNNFSSIYQSIILRPGNVVRTGTPNLDLFASATITESVENEVGIYNLKKFLSILSLFKGSDPDVEFTPTHAVISTGKRNIQYTLSDQTLIKGAPSKDPAVPEPVTTFPVNAEELDNATKALSVLELPELIFSVSSEGVFIKAANIKNTSKDKYSFRISDAPEGVADVDVRIPKNSFKMLERDYVVSVHPSYVKLENPDVSYWIPALAD